MLTYQIAIREFASFTCREGDLEATTMGGVTALDGIKAHSVIQSRRKEESGFQKEVPVKFERSFTEFIVKISGRIDGVFYKQDMPILEEIKTVMELPKGEALNKNKVHLGQVMVYAYLFALENKKKDVGVRLTYVEHNSYQTVELNQSYSFDELEEFFNSKLELYVNWMVKQSKWQKKRNQSIKDLHFPFDYRTGQRPLAVAVFKTIQREDLLFAEAPTGIGKTLATLFPAIKSLAHEEVEKIFFLTAKTMGRQVALKTVLLLAKKGLSLRTLVLTAKDKICPHPEVPCDPLYCRYAKGYFDRVRDAIDELLMQEILTQESIQKLASDFKVCPFELSLDASLWCDVIIGDFNYAFDPTVYLQRHFTQEKRDFVLLLDEAHNLVDRSREMYSAEIAKNDFMQVRRKIKKDFPIVGKRLEAINRFFLKIRKSKSFENSKADTASKYFTTKEAPESIGPCLQRFIKSVQEQFKGQHFSSVSSDLLDSFFAAIKFIKILELFDDNFFTIYEDKGKNLVLKLFCIDPSSFLQERLSQVKAAVFFSATLSPFPYYARCLTGREDPPFVKLDSPFNPNNLKLLVNYQISTYYRDRQNSLKELVRLILELVNKKKGNYLIYFPSHAYLKMVEKEIEHHATASTFELLVQGDHMTEDEREAFLGSFSRDNSSSLVALAVMGGVFGEGIDLVGDLLIGVMVVGVGFPKLCVERDLIRDFFDQKGAGGLAYAYKYPGMNKVLQTAGRVIRGAEDRGWVCLVDNRFIKADYRQLFPRFWQPRFHKNTKEAALELEDFWRY